MGEYALERPPKKPGGSAALALGRDKTKTGEYVLGRLPKNLWGGLRTVMFLLCLGMMIDGAECRRTEEGVRRTIDRFFFCFFLVMLVVTVIYKDVRTFLEERSYTFVAMNIAIRIFTENFERVIEKYENMKSSNVAGYSEY